MAKQKTMQKVTAAVIQRDGKVLIARRKPGGHMGEKWEFPGGKIDAGETPRECLRRELEEEFSIQARIGEFLCSAAYVSPGLELELLAYRAEHLCGSFVLREHTEIRWVAPAELQSYDLADSDRLIARELNRRLKV